jgi:hypothetical protein
MYANIFWGFFGPDAGPIEYVLLLWAEEDYRPCVRNLFYLPHNIIIILLILKRETTEKSNKKLFFHVTHLRQNLTETY